MSGVEGVLFTVSEGKIIHRSLETSTPQALREAGAGAALADPASSRGRVAPRPAHLVPSDLSHSLGTAHPPLSKLGCSHGKRRDPSLDFCLYVRHERISKRSGVQIFVTSVEPARGVLLQRITTAGRRYRMRKVRTRAQALFLFRTARSDQTHLLLYSAGDEP
jgi:hypothetical protein